MAIDVSNNLISRLANNPAFLDFLRGKARGRGTPTWTDKPNAGRLGGYQGWQPGMPRAPGNSPMPGGRVGGTYAPSGNIPAGGASAGIGGSGIGGSLASRIPLGNMKLAFRGGGSQLLGMPGIAASGQSVYPSVRELAGSRPHLGLLDKLQPGRNAQAAPPQAQNGGSMMPVPIPPASSTPPPAQPIPPAIAGDMKPTPIGTSNFPYNAVMSGVSAPINMPATPLPRPRPQMPVPMPQPRTALRNVPLPSAQPSNGMGPRTALGNQGNQDLPSILNALFGHPVQRDRQTGADIRG